MIEKIKSEKKLEYITLFLFVFIYCIITVFHEPWFDEAQAWQIAKCASLKEMIFEIPHYEGHPPLWWLLLSIPAKLGVPFEIGLKTIGLLISTTSAILMIFCSKLPRIIRLTIPFTYFFFYQYGVIVRPYGLMLLCFLLLGINLPQRKEHPWRIFALLLLLCLTSAYGILLAGGISVCILWDILKEKGVKSLCYELFTDSCTLSLILLLVVAILLILEIMPNSNAYGTNIEGSTTFLSSIICALFTFPVECFLSTSSWFGIEQVSMKSMHIPIIELIIFSIIGSILFILLVSFSSKKGLKYFFLPYILYSCFAATVYFSTHHMGIVFLLVVFYVEFSCRDSSRFKIGKQICKKIAKNDKDERLIRLSYLVILCASITVPLYWCVTASLHEITNNYCFARNVADFLKKNNLEDRLILCEWNDSGSIFPKSEGNNDYINNYVIGTAALINAYFENNICFNLNEGNDNQAYVIHKVANYEQSRAAVDQWRVKGSPDVIIGHPNLEYVYGNKISYDSYALVYVCKSGFIWKNAMSKGVLPIYLKRSLLDEYHLDIISDPKLEYWTDGLIITDEMRQDYENGVPMEEILKPYLDVMFGPEE